MNDDIFFNRLRFLRQKHKLTQKDLAKMLSTTQNTISNWESGRQEPSREKLIMLGKIFNIPVTYLFGTDEKTMKKLEELTPKIIEDTFASGSDYSKFCLETALNEYNRAKDQLEKNNNKENLIEYIIKQRELDNILFSIAEDELLFLEPDYLN